MFSIIMATVTALTPYQLSQASGCQILGGSYYFPERDSCTVLGEQGLTGRVQYKDFFGTHTVILSGKELADLAVGTAGRKHHQ